LPRQRSAEKAQPGAGPFHNQRKRSKVRCFAILSVLIPYLRSEPGKKAEWRVNRASAIYSTNRHSLVLFGNVEILKAETLKVERREFQFVSRQFSVAGSTPCEKQCGEVLSE
jgi:hypothetical protein